MLYNLIYQYILTTEHTTEGLKLIWLGNFLYGSQILNREPLLLNDEDLLYSTCLIFGIYTIYQ